MQHQYKTLLVDIRNKIAKITLNRPDKRNAMNPQLHIEMADCLEKLRYDDSVAVLVITGSGKQFCAGMDLKEFFYDLKLKNPAEYDRIWRIATDWRGRTLRYYPKPTIAMINGFCFGGAFALVEGCDLAVAADEATFGLSEVNFRHFPGGVAAKALANLFRPRDAMLYSMTGRTFDGKKAAEMGFVNFSVPLAKLEQETMALATELAGKDPMALRACKHGYRFILEMSWEASVSWTRATESELHLAQKDNSWIERGIGDFVDGKYRPGLEGHEGVGT
jgi:trans-feruloyl-CoA hydratase/vanillin synthase